jgi:hypothetical protein
MLGLASGIAGSAWDVAWHRSIGRDSFWILPHVLTYAGVTLNGIAAIIATATAMAGRPVVGREMRVGPLRAELGLALVGVGSALVIASAPFDDMWHRTLGPDIDIWSAPHLTAIAASGLVYLGWATALAPGVFPISDAARRALRIGMFAAMTGTAVFGLNFYYFMAVTREALFYPLLVCAVIPFILAAGAVVTGERDAWTKIALVHTTVALLVFGALDATGWPPPAFPPLILAGALAADLARRRTASLLIAAVAFTAAFVVAEWIRMLVFPAPPLGFVGTGRAARLLMEYYGQALARPWTSAWPLAAMAIGAIITVVAQRAGTRVGRMLDS